MASKRATKQKRAGAKKSAGPTAARGPGARLMPRTQAFVSDHEAFDGEEVHFVEGRLVVRSPKLRKAIMNALPGKRRGSHSAMIRFVKEGTGQVPHGDPDVVVDVRC